MKTIAAGVVAGGFVGFLILALGVSVAAAIAIPVAVAVIIVGAIDYVRTHG